MLGSSLGKSFDGHKLLALFAVLMIVIAVWMQRRRSAASAPRSMSGAAAGKIAGTGFAVGTISGFFGIGGSFLIVPDLVFAAGMPVIDAIGSSLVGGGAFGLTTAVNYALSGLVAWTVAADYIVGGVAGGWVGGTPRPASRSERPRGVEPRLRLGAGDGRALHAGPQSARAVMAAD